MNREIKMRAWFKGDIEKGSPLKFEMFKNEEDARLEFRMVSDTSFSYDAFSVINDENWTVEQFTGYKDENDVEIYEGDHFGEPAYPVTFSEGAFWHEGELLRDGYECRTIEGNIHEK